MAVPVSNLREESKGENKGPSASFFCSPRRTTRSQSPQKGRKSASPPGRNEQPRDPVPRTYNESESKSKFGRPKR